MSICSPTDGLPNWAAANPSAQGLGACCQCLGVLQIFLRRKGDQLKPSDSPDVSPWTRPLLDGPSPGPSGGGALQARLYIPGAWSGRQGGGILGGLVHGPALCCHYNTYCPHYNTYCPPPTMSLLPTSDLCSRALRPESGQKASSGLLTAHPAASSSPAEHPLSLCLSASLCVSVSQTIHHSGC